MILEIKPKETTFKAVRVTGHPEQFGELKRMCGGSIHISYESCHIDDYWLIKLDDDLRHSKEIIADGDYIVEIGEGMFTKVSSEDFNDFFEITNDVI